MNKIKLFYILIFSCMFSFLTPYSYAETNPTLRSLSVNRSLLARYRSELNQAESKKKQEALQYKIKALVDDQSRLMGQLPENLQAYELMKDLLTFGSNKAVVEKQASSESPPPLSPTRALHEQALHYVAQNDLSQAIKIYEQITLEDVNDDQAYLLMGHCQLFMGQYEKAEAAYHNAVNIDASNREEIAPFYENIILQNPSDDVAYSNLGYAYLILGDFLKARDAFKDALSINPNNTHAMKGLEKLNV